MMAQRKTGQQVAPPPKPQAPRDPYTMTDQEILIQIARDNLARYGSTIPPEGVVPQVAPSEIRRIAPRARREIDPKWFKALKVCPHCGEEKNVGKDFGVVVRRGIEGPAGWCRACRSATNYRAKPRKNKTKHNPKP